MHRRDGVHWIPIVHRRPKFDAASVALPQDPASAASARGIQFPELEEQTEEDKRAVAKFWDAAPDDSRFAKTPEPTPGEKAKGRRKKKKGQRPEVPATVPVTEVLAPDMETLLTKFADVFPSELPKGSPPPRPTDHRIML